MNPLFHLFIEIRNFYKRKGKIQKVLPRMVLLPSLVVIQKNMDLMLWSRYFVFDIFDNNSSCTIYYFSCIRNNSKRTNGWTQIHFGDILFLGLLETSFLKNMDDYWSVLNISIVDLLEYIWNHIRAHSKEKCPNLGVSREVVFLWITFSNSAEFMVLKFMIILRIWFARQRLYCLTDGATQRVRKRKLLDELINNFIFLERYSQVTGHQIDKDRVSTAYSLLDDDVKVSINLRFWLHVDKNMLVTRSGFKVFKIFYWYYIWTRFKKRTRRVDAKLWQTLQLYQASSKGIVGVTGIITAGYLRIIQEFYNITSFIW